MSDERPEWAKYQDPTKLTTDALNKLEKEIQIRMDLLKDILESKIDCAKAVREEELRNIKVQLAANDVAVQAAFKANKDLMDAQNKSNTEAAAKAEQAFKEQIASLTTFMNASFTSMSKSVDDLKGVAAADKGAAASQSRMMSLVALAITVAGFLFFISSHAWVAGPTVSTPVSSAPR